MERFILRSVIIIMSRAHELLRWASTATLRELYYMDCWWFRADDGGQERCNAAILEACEVLQEPRHRLNILASPRGFFTGCIRVRPAHSRADGGWLDPRITGEACGAPITSAWLTHEMEVESDARFILVVEKDTIFKRLCTDGLPGRLPCIMITGQGYPPLAVRAMVCSLHRHLGIPAYAMVDNDPHGLCILLTYKCGSLRSESSKYTIADMR
jgi:DNA topoisomerase VI subunit A